MDDHIHPVARGNWTSNELGLAGCNGVASLGHVAVKITRNVRRRHRKGF